MISREYIEKEKKNKEPFLMNTEATRNKMKEGKRCGRKETNTGKLLFR